MIRFRLCSWHIYIIYIYNRHIHIITIANLENKNASEKQKHLICVSMVETLIYDLETLVYVSETHNFIHA
jgi:hypothetical protein